MGAPQKTKIAGRLFSWDVAKTSRNFRAYVVEPEAYDPPTHGEIFLGAISSLISPAPEIVSGFEVPGNIQAPSAFDLVTFPEAFLPADILVDTMTWISGLPYFGGIHVGLRPKGNTESHLFSRDETASLLIRLLDIPNVEKDDIEPTREWLKDQPQESRFNLGCFFLVDAGGKVRVCIHPKMVRSKFEFSVLPENFMAEGNILTLITLKPEDRTFLSVTVQPLLCSDAILSVTDHGVHPLTGITQNASIFDEFPPDHVDIVSVATCTEQFAGKRDDGTEYFAWHQLFKRTFEAANMEPGFTRHRYATFVLSNFRQLEGPQQGGLSGAYIPVSIGATEFPAYAEISSFGRENGEKENGWSHPVGISDGKREVRGYLAQTTPTPTETCAARMFGFTIVPLPRHESAWNKHQGLGNFQLRLAVRNADSTGLNYKISGGLDV
jgi:hypothetical protein